MKNLENCIATCQVEKLSVLIARKLLSLDNDITVVKLQRANGGYLGTQRRRRTWLPTICAGELEAGIDPAVSEWGNPVYGHLNP